MIDSVKVGNILQYIRADGQESSDEESQSDQRGDNDDDLDENN